MIEELGYQPNILARSLITRRSETLAIVASGLDYYGPSQAVVGIEREAERLGYSILLELVPWLEPVQAQRALTMLAGRQVGAPGAPAGGDDLGEGEERLGACSLAWIDCLLDNHETPGDPADDFMCAFGQAPHPQLCLPLIRDTEDVDPKVPYARYWPALPGTFSHLQGDGSCAGSFVPANEEKGAFEILADGEATIAVYGRNGARFYRLADPLCFNGSAAASRFVYRTGLLVDPETEFAR